MTQFLGRHSLDRGSRVQRPVATEITSDQRCDELDTDAA
jgi:hypothetical protein